MTYRAPFLLPLIALSLAACGSQAESEADALADAVEQQANADALAAGSEIAALGMTEAQLLEANLVTPSGDDLGDVEQIRRDASGAVEALVVELDDTDPDRWVAVPISGLSARRDGDDVDVQTSMTAADLAALPDAQMTMPVAPTPAG